MLFFVLAALYAISGALLVKERQALSDADRDLGTFSEYVDAHDAANAGGAFAILVGIAVFVLLIIWAHRSRKNLDAFGVADPPLSSGMAIGLWFIPFASMVLGYILLNGVWKGSDPENPSPAWRQRASSAIFNLWWWTWTVGWIVGLIGGFNVNFDDEISSITSVSEELRRLAARASSSFLLMIACVFAGIAVGQFAKRQHAKAARLAGAQPGYGGGYGGGYAPQPPTWG